MLAVRVENLVKEYRSPVKQPGLMGSFRNLIRPVTKPFLAVNSISFTIEPGEIVGFLGPNGAGKTTTLKMLTGILHASSGVAEVLGYQPFRREPEFLRQIALVMGNRQQLWWDLPAWDSFVVLRELYDVPKSDFDATMAEILPILDLEDKMQTQVRKLSLGERMKCELAASLLHRPKVIFLDEPTIGLDLTSQQRIRAFLREHQRRTGCTILLTSHYMQDVEELCERVIVINHGSLAFDGSMASMIAAWGSERRLHLTLSKDVDAADLAKHGRIVKQEGLEAILAIDQQGVPEAVAGALKALPVHDLSIEEPSIEEIIGGIYAQSAPVSRETGPGTL